MPPSGGGLAHEGSLFVHINAGALASSAATGSSVVPPDLNAGFVRAIELTTNTEIGAFGPNYSGKPNERSDHLL